MLFYYSKNVKTLAYFEQKLSIISCGKLYHRDIWQDGPRFPEQLFFEDTYLFFEILQRCKKSIAIPDVLYHYRVHQNSITQQKPNHKKMHDNIKVSAHQKEIMQKFGDPELLALCLKSIRARIGGYLMRQEGLSPLDFELQRYWIECAAENGLGAEMAEVLAHELSLCSPFITNVYLHSLLSFVRRPNKEKWGRIWRRLAK